MSRETKAMREFMHRIVCRAKDVTESLVETGKGARNLAQGQVTNKEKARRSLVAIP